MKRLRVLLCLTSLDPSHGGIPSVNRNVVRALQSFAGARLELEIRALVYHDDHPQLRDEYLRHLRRFRIEGCGSSRWRFLARYLWFSLRWRPALVFVDHLHLAVVCCLARWLVSSGYVLFCHGSEFDGALSPSRRAAFRGAVLRLGNSRFTARRLMAMFPGVAVEPCELGLEELAVCPNAAEDGRCLPDSFGSAQPLGNRFVLIVSRLAAGERYKGHDQLIGIMPALVKDIPAAQLVVAGDGDDRERLKGLARASGVGHAVLFPGFVAPGVLANLFSRCRLFAMPSRGEGFGLVYLEAMRFGKPCIASRVDAGSEVIIDGLNGLLVDPTDLPELREAVASLLGDADLAERMGLAGLERLNRQFRFSHFQRRLRKQLSRIVPELGAGGPAPDSASVLVPAND